MRQLDGAQLASFGRRAFAFALDLAIGWLIFMALLIVVLLMSPTIARQLRGDAVPGEDTTFGLNCFENWYSVLWWVAYFGLATYFGNGRTLGKRLVGIRVVSLVHDRISLWHSIERALGYGASALELGFGFIQYFVHPNRRTVHDRIAETIVVVDKPNPATRQLVPEVEKLFLDRSQRGRLANTQMEPTRLTIMTIVSPRRATHLAR